MREIGVRFICGLGAIGLRGASNRLGGRQPELCSPGKPQTLSVVTSLSLLDQRQESEC